MIGRRDNFQELDKGGPVDCCNRFEALSVGDDGEAVDISTDYESDPVLSIVPETQVAKDEAVRRPRRVEAQAKKLN